MFDGIDYIVIGSGLSGAVIAERIASQLDQKVLVVEKKNHIGGHCFDFKNNENILIHKYGPHIFHTNNANVFNYLSGFTEWDMYSHKVLAMVDGKKVPIPFNLNTIYDVFPNVLAEKIEYKLLQQFEYNSKVPILELMTSPDEDLQFLANFVYNKIFKQYTIKQWGVKPEGISPKVTARVPIFIGRDDRYFNDVYQCVPKNGYTKLIDNILNHKNIKVMLNTSFNEIGNLEEKKISLFGSHYSGHLIYTGQVDELFNYKFGELPYRSIDMRFETIDTAFYQECGTINYPNDYDFTRITEFKHIHKVNSLKTTILKEYPEEYKQGINNPYYPVFTDNNQFLYGEYFEYSKNFSNITLLGRLAEYKYYDMDDAVERALKVYQDEIH